MATSFHVYDNIETYNTRYGNNRNLLEFSSNIIDCFIKGEKIYVITNTNLEKERPQLHRTIVHFRNGKADDYLDGDEILVLHDKTHYNPKNNNVEFGIRFLRKPLLKFFVGRFHGDKPKKCKKVDWSQRFYDVINDRINLVLKNER
tara:strand:+ start:2715 stop:3152 length:438 start_codon:yes stop_codon:yes gene_type:complete